MLNVMTKEWVMDGHAFQIDNAARYRDTLLEFPSVILYSLDIHQIQAPSRFLRRRNSYIKIHLGSWLDLGISRQYMRLSRMSIIAAWIAPHENAGWMGSV